LEIFHLSKTEIIILSELACNPCCTTRSFPDDYLPAIKRLSRLGYVQCHPKIIGSVWMWPVKITRAGLDALSECKAAREKLAQDIAYQQSEQQRVAKERSSDIRREYVLFFLGLLLGWLLGLITPADVWAFLSSLLH
jgi:hypothetical protein